MIERAGAEGDGGVVVVLNRDLMFGVRIRNDLRALGYEVRFARETGAFLETLRELAANARLGILDMNGEIDWGRVAEFVSAEPQRAPLLAFGPHVDVEGRRAAKGAGVDRIVSNGEFHREMVALVQRYARSG